MLCHRSYPGNGFLSLGPSRAGSLMGLRAQSMGSRAEQRKASRPLEGSLHAALSGFIGDSSPAASVEGARRSRCKTSPATVAAGFVLRTVKRRQARYKLALHGVVLT